MQCNKNRDVCSLRNISSELMNLCGQDGRND